MIVLGARNNEIHRDDASKTTVQEVVRGLENLLRLLFLDPRQSP